MLRGAIGRPVAVSNRKRLVEFASPVGIWYSARMEKPSFVGSFCSSSAVPSLRNAYQPHKHFLFVGPPSPASESTLSSIQTPSLERTPFRHGLLVTLCTRGFTQSRCLHCCSDCYRVERTSSRAGYSRCGPPPSHGAPGNANLPSLWNRLLEERTRGCELRGLAASESEAKAHRL